MATATFMASFNKDVVETNVFSEANAVTYKFHVGGMTNYSANAFLKRNDTVFTGTIANGLNLRCFTGESLAETKSYELTAVGSTMNNSFKTFMDTALHELIILFSGKNLKGSSDIDQWFTDKGSVAWPGSFMVNNYSCGYVGFYSPSLKRIVAEVAIYSDGSELGLAEHTLVFDTLNDVGVLGMPYRAVYDPSEYTTTNGYEFKRFPSDLSIDKMVNYKMAPGRTYMIQATVQASPEMAASNMKTRLNLRWFKGTSLLDASTVLESSGGNASQVIAYSKAPVDADGFTIVASRYPRNDSVAGKASIKNFVFTEVSKDGSEIGSNAMIGVNGIKASGFIESQISPHLMDLGLDIPAVANIVPIVGMREGDSGTPPPP